LLIFGYVIGYPKTRKRLIMTIHANLPYTYRNPKYRFLAIFILKRWTEHFGVITKVVELTKTDLPNNYSSMQILPYTYSNQKTVFLALFMFKCCSEEFDVIDKVVELFKAHLLHIKNIYANPTVHLQ